MNVATDEAEKFKTDFDLDGRVNSVGPTYHHHDQDDDNDDGVGEFDEPHDDDQLWETEGEQTSDQGKSNRKIPEGNLEAKYRFKCRT